MSAQRAVFLDRDGVLVKAVIRDGRPHPPQSLDQLEILPGVVEACEAFRAAGLRLVCITNQPDIARGLTTRATVDRQNALLESLLGLDGVLVCPHDDDDECPCRKPLPGLLLEGASRFDIDLRSSVMVGDRWRDVEAGQNAGCRTVFIQQHYEEQQPESPDLTIGSLLAATPWILEATRPRQPKTEEQP